MNREHSILLSTLSCCGLFYLAIANPICLMLAQKVNMEFWQIKSASFSDILVFLVALYLIPSAFILTLFFIAQKISYRIFTIIYFSISLFFILTASLTFANQLFDNLLYWATIASALLLFFLFAYLYISKELLKQISAFICVSIFISPMVLILSYRENIHSYNIEGIDINRSNTTESITPIFWIVLDELPTFALLDKNLNIDKNRFPNLHQFSSQATWYKTANAVSDRTQFALPAMLTGEYPTKSVSPKFIHYRNNIFTLSPSNYRLKALESVTHLCPDELCERQLIANNQSQFSRNLENIKDSLTIYLHSFIDHEPIDMAFFTIEKQKTDTDTDSRKDRLSKDRLSNEGRVALVDKFIDSIDSNKRSLYFLHLPLPHRPYSLLPDGSTYGYCKTLENKSSKDHYGLHIVSNKWAARQTFQRLILQMSFTDQLIGKILTQIKAQQIYNDALIIISADHGISFTPNKAINSDNFNDTAYVPLLIKYPQQQTANVMLEPVQTTDITPTLLKELDISVIGDGQALQNLKNGTVRQRKLFPAAIGMDNQDIKSLDLPFFNAQDILSDFKQRINFYNQNFTSAFTLSVAIDIPESINQLESDTIEKITYKDQIPSWTINKSVKETGLFPFCLSFTLKETPTNPDAIYLLSYKNKTIANTKIAMKKNNTITFLNYPQVKIDANSKKPSDKVAIYKINQ